MPSIDRTTIKIAAPVARRLGQFAADAGVSRSRAVELLLDGDDGTPVEPPADHDESLAILSRLARAEKVGAAVALERALRSSAEPSAAAVDEFDELRARRRKDAQ